MRLFIKKHIKALQTSPSFGLQFFLLGRFAGMFLVSILLAKSSLFLQNPLSVAEIGKYEMVLFLSGLISFFWVNALIKSTLSFVNTNQPSFENQISQIFLLFIFLSLLSSILFFSAHYCFGFYAETNSLVIWASMFYTLFWTPSLIFEYYHLLQKRRKILVLSGIFTPITLIICVGTGLYLSQNISGAIWGTVVYGFFRLLISSFSFLTTFPKIDFLWMKQFLLFSIPLVLSSIIAESGPFIDGIIISYLFDEKSFALYRYGARELPFNSILATGLSNAFLPLFAQTERPTAETLNQLNKSTEKLLLTLVPCSTILIIFSQFLFTHLFDPQFASAARIFDVYLLLVLPRLLFPQTIIMGFKQNRLLVPVAVLEVISNIILSLWWAYLWGIVGIALATLVSFIVEKITLIYLTRKHLSIKPFDYIPAKTFIILSSIIFVVFFIKYTFFLSFVE